MTVLPPLEAGVGSALERQRLADATLVVAVSGGADSIALLHCLHALRSSMGLTLHVAHLNHDFRGEEAEEDARFVGRVAAGLELSASVERADPLAYQRERRISSFEAAARELRYDFLARVARQVGADAVALGHTADDQAETVLMHILRGSGPEGLRGMAEHSRWHSPTGGPGVVLFRPLLGSTKAETLAYCRERGIPYREDPGNVDPRFTRNLVRHRLLPAMRDFNPKVREALLRLSRSASRDEEYLEAQVDGIWDRAAKVEGDCVELDKTVMATLHPALRLRALRRAYIRLVGDARRLEGAHLEAMSALVDAPAGKLVTLPQGLKLLSGYGKLILGPEPESLCPYPPLEGEHPLTLPIVAGDASVTEVPGWRITARRLPGPPTLPGDDAFAAYLDPGCLGPTPLYARSRRPGDRFHPLGMPVEKKLQDFFVDQKVPRGWRDRVPLVVSEEGIAWVVGYRVAEWARASGTGEVLEIRFDQELPVP